MPKRSRSRSKSSKSGKGISCTFHVLWLTCLSFRLTTIAEMFCVPIKAGSFGLIEATISYRENTAIKQRWAFFSQPIIIEVPERKNKT